MPRRLEEKVYIAISGGFDPIHAGHIAYLQAAAKYARVLVFLNTDEWLMRKKDLVFMPWDERAIILRSIKWVTSVLKAKDDDDTVCKSLETSRYQIGYFGNGGDRTNKNTPEASLCRKLGIELIYGLGGGKTQSSSQLVKNVQACS